MSLKDIPVVTVEQIVRFREKAISIEQQRDNLLLALKSLLYASHHCSEMDWVGEDDPWFNATFLVQEIEATK
jgi:hypothetical protein